MWQNGLKRVYVCLHKYVKTRHRK